MFPKLTKIGYRNKHKTMNELPNYSVIVCKKNYVCFVIPVAYNRFIKQL